MNLLIHLPILKAYHAALSWRVSRDNAFDDACGLRDRKSLVCLRMFHYRQCFSREIK